MVLNFKGLITVAVSYCLLAVSCLPFVSQLRCALSFSKRLQRYNIPIAVYEFLGNFFQKIFESVTSVMSVMCH